MARTRAGRQGEQQPERGAEDDGPNRALVLGSERDVDEDGLLLAIGHPDRLRPCGHV